MNAGQAVPTPSTPSPTPAAAQQTPQPGAPAAGGTQQSEGHPQAARSAWEDLRNELSTLDPNNFEEKKLNTIINIALELKIDVSVQNELVRLARLLKKVSGMGESTGKITCMAWAALVIGALLRPEPEMVVARGLMNTIETELLMQKRWGGWVVKFFDGHQMIPFASGLAVSVLTACSIVGILLLCFDKTDEKFMYIELTVMFAFLGGIASLVVRLPSTSSLQDQSVFVVFWTAFFKPYLGALFGTVIYFTVKSGTIQIVDGAVLKGPHFWGVLGFISGWSERFASDIIYRVAERVPSTGDPRPGIAPAPVSEQKRDE